MNDNVVDTFLVVIPDVRPFHHNWERNGHVLLLHMRAVSLSTRGEVRPPWHCLARGDLVHDWVLSLAARTASPSSGEDLLISWHFQATYASQTIFEASFQPRALLVLLECISDENTVADSCLLCSDSSEGIAKLRQVRMCLSIEVHTRA